jgi:hypothetical protein
MANCGVKKYDDLPAVVSGIDVDMLRWALWRNDHPWRVYSVPVLGWVIRFFTMPSTPRARIVRLLDIAVVIHNGRK